MVLISRWKRMKSGMRICNRGQSKEMDYDIL